MKQLYLLRHGKSSWKYTELSDFERPLNDRGRRDVPLMAGVLARLQINPDLIMSSPALRAYSTVRTVSHYINYNLEDIRTSELIYESGLRDLMHVIQQTDDENESLLIAGHNPGLTVLSNSLSDKYIDNLPTTGFVHIELNIESWKNVVADCGKQIRYEYPKKYLS